MTMPPCIRHGERGIADDRLLRALGTLGGDAWQKIESLTDFDGQLWATWRRPDHRTELAPDLSRAWAAVGGDRGALHLVRIDEDYDYQEDCMNDAS